MTATLIETKQAFVPNAVYIPNSAFWQDGNTTRAEANECTLLMTEGEGWGAPAYTKEAWEQGLPPTFLFRNQDWYRLPDGLDGAEVVLQEVEGTHIFSQHTGVFTDGEGYIHFLPDMWIVKIAEDLSDWSEDIRERVTAIWSVYAFNRRKHVHMCEVTPSYELAFIEYQYAEAQAVSEDDYLRDVLNEDMMEAASDNRADGGGYSYTHTHEIEAMLKNEIRPGFYPEPGKSGGYRFLEPDDPITAVLDSDALDEIWETQATSSI